MVETDPEKLTHITLRPVSSNVSFLTTIIQDDRNVPTFSYGQSLTLIESALGDAGHIDGVTIMPLALNSWLLTGFSKPFTTHPDLRQTEQPCKQAAPAAIRE